MHPDSQFSTFSGNNRDLKSLKSLLTDRATSFVGTVVVVEGIAELLDSASIHARPVESGMRLARQVTLRVRTGRMMIRMDDGSDLWLAAGAELDFSLWSSATRRVRLAVGRALALIARETKRSFTMECPSGNILVTGTAFEADAAATQLSVAVLHGSVEVSSDRGKARATRGQVALSRNGAAPTVGKASSTAGTWIGRVDASASNQKVTPAYRAVAETMERRAGRGTEKSPMKNSSTGLVVAGIVLALIAGAVGVAVMASRDNAPPPVASASGSTSTLEATAGGPKPIGGQARKAKIRLRDDAGKDFEFEFSPGAPQAELDAKIASLPPEQQEMARKVMEKINNEGGKFSFTSSTETGHGDSVFKGGENLVSREASASADAMKKLIEQGMSPAEASRIVSQALSDSLQKQINDPNAKVKAIVSNGAPAGTTLTGPDGKPIVVPEGATMLMIGVDKTMGGDETSDLEVKVGGGS